MQEREPTQNIPSGQKLTFYNQPGYSSEHQSAFYNNNIPTNIQCQYP